MYLFGSWTWWYCCLLLSLSHSLTSSLPFLLYKYLWESSHWSLIWMLTGTRPWLRHLRVNLLWFLKLAIFISNFSHRLRFKTPSFPYSDLILACRLLILFVLMCNQLYFSRTELIFEFWDKLLPVSNMASSRSEENVNLNYYTNWWCHSNGETCNIFGKFHNNTWQML